MTIQFVARQFKRAMVFTLLEEGDMHVALLGDLSVMTEIVLTEKQALDLSQAIPRMIAQNQLLEACR